MRGGRRVAPDALLMETITARSRFAHATDRALNPDVVKVEFVNCALRVRRHDLFKPPA